jgi:hypothetical protein
VELKMSRSRKKALCVKVGDPDYKNIHNRQLRRRLKNPEYDLSSGGSYKKVFEQWSIWDYVSWYASEKSYVERHRWSITNGYYTEAEVWVHAKMLRSK